MVHMYCVGGTLTRYISVRNEIIYQRIPKYLGVIPMIVSWTIIGNPMKQLKCRKIETDRQRETETQRDIQAERDRDRETLTD